MTTFRFIVHKSWKRAVLEVGQNRRRTICCIDTKESPLNDDEVDKLTSAYENFKEKFVIWTLLDTGLRLSESEGLTKDNIQWQEKRLVIYGKGGSSLMSK